MASPRSWPSTKWRIAPRKLPRCLRPVGWMPEKMRTVGLSPRTENAGRGASEGGACESPCRRNVTSAGGQRVPLPPSARAPRVARIGRARVLARPAVGDVVARAPVAGAEAIAAALARQDVASRAAGQRSLPGPPVTVSLPSSTGEHVVPVPAADHVVPFRGVDHVVAAAGADHVAARRAEQDVVARAPAERARGGATAATAGAGARDVDRRRDRLDRRAAVELEPIAPGCADAHRGAEAVARDGGPCESACGRP